MRHRRLTLASAGLLLAALPCPVPACTLCINVRQTPTFRQEAANPAARLILYGSLANARLSGDAGKGQTDLCVEAVLKADPGLAREQRKGPGDRVLLPYYLPPKAPGVPPRYLVFCDVAGGRLDPYRCVEVASAASAAYLRGALALDPRDSTRSLLYFFRHLDDP